jgi:ABC-type methionine transport system ATPase subunit
MPGKSPSKRAPAKPPIPGGVQHRRLWLMYPARMIKEPVVWQVGRKFPVVTNVRQASVTEEIGIVCLEISGEREAVKSAIAWLEQAGVKVEPVEINVIES